MASALAGRRVLVTGASGFVGSHVVERLLGHGAEVYAVTSSASSGAPSRLADVLDHIVLLEADVADVASVGAVVSRSRPELVLHLAAFTHVGKSFTRIDETIETNISGTVNLLQALGGDFERLVYMSTADVYGDGPVPFREDGPVQPASPYAAAKYAAERFCRMFADAYGWPIVCLRPFNVYGPRQSPDRIIPELILSALGGRDIKMTTGGQTREFTFVEEAAEVFVQSLVQPDVVGQVINIGRGDEVAIRDLASTVLGLMGNPVQARFGELEDRPNEIWRMFGDSSKAKRLLNWSPEVSLEDGLRTTIEWFRHAQGDQLNRDGGSSRKE
jgi:nucleoside-diphosphate-sugar epimerase